MSEGWRDHEPGRQGLSVAGLSDGESLTARVIAEPYRRDTEQSQDALHVPVKVADAPDDFRDMNDEDIDSEREYNIINSSTGFFNGLLEAFPEGQDIVDEVITITADQPGDVYTRSYEITAE